MKLSSINTSDLFHSARVRAGGFIRWILIQGNPYLRLSLLLLMAIVGVIVIVNALYDSSESTPDNQLQVYELDTRVLDELELWIEERHDQQRVQPTVRSSAFTRS